MNSMIYYRSYHFQGGVFLSSKVHVKVCWFYPSYLDHFIDIFWHFSAPIEEVYLIIWNY